MTSISKTKILARTGLFGALTLGLSACAGGLFGGGDDDNTTPTVGERIPILSRIETGAQVDPALASVQVVLPPAQTNASFAQAGGTASKSYGHLALGQQPTKAWTAQIAGSSNRARLGAAPVVGGGRLYAVDVDGTVYAFDAQTGARIWTRNAALENNLRNSAFGGGVSFDSGKLYGTNGAGEVIAMDAATGNELWKVTPSGPLRGSPTVAFGSVYVMTQDNQIFALDANDGSLQWQESASSTQAGVFGVAAPAVGQGTVIAGYSSGELVAYRYENGRSLWADALARTSISTQVGTLTDIDADPIIDNGRVYALGQGGRMAAYELVTGQRIWELNLAGISTPAIAGEWIFTLTDDARLLAIARSTGKVRWLTQLAEYRNVEKKKDPIFWTGPVLAGNSLWLVNSRGELWRVSTGEGSAQLYQELGEPVSLPPVVANETLYILDDSGRIHAFR
ncbi:pyrrolo-quinoline quinone [Erythrobacter sp. HI0063]|jgi:outer membrane protein assembly factor BamB|uniref:outer membrane protein assembly factor BamB family protein n=1 Tax=unclassified Erythrobacter TaxID=2633097 RepID=UPI0007C3F9AE|nr:MULTISPECIES: PQQ-binding-like beta-propeller repeat protein [unclassified Erythrobacter]KZY55926.1 pyrrolo-quinoline quinone [Erythrobacter sp. HI0063]MBO9511060.1 PQQ-binding-like beta-propeller repeat protein [Erythrobacter sp. A6_0]